MCISGDFDGKMKESKIMMYKNDLKRLKQLVTNSAFKYEARLFFQRYF